MPTTVVSTIGSGRDYSTIQAWEDACPANLVSADQIWKGLLYDEGGGTNGEWTISTNVTFSGVTTDATRYVWLDAAAGRSFVDNANRLTNALRYNTANGVAIRCNSSYAGAMFVIGYGVKFTRLQIKRLLGAGNAADEIFGINGAFTADQCLLVNEGNDYSISVGAGSLNFINSLFYCASVSKQFIFSVISSSSGNLINSAIYGNGSTSAFDIRYTGSLFVSKNCGLFNWTSIGSTARFDSANSSNNATNLSSVGFGSANQVSLTTANQFENVTAGSEDFRVKTGAALINNGIRQQTYTNDLDIVGTARSTTTPTIGAWEFASITYTYARPTSDITTQWTPSTGTDHYALIDETTANDSDYIYATAAGQTDEVRLASMTAPQAGTDLLINYRVQGIVGSASVTLSLVCNTTVHATDTTRIANGDYTLTVPSGTWASVADWTNMRLRFVSA
jgi:hypothetical protein